MPPTRDPRAVSVLPAGDVAAPQKRASRRVYGCGPCSYRHTLASNEPGWIFAFFPDDVRAAPSTEVEPPFSAGG